MKGSNITIPKLPETRQLTPKEERLWLDLFRKKYGYDPVHMHIITAPWIISTWNSAEVPELKEMQRSFADQLARNPRAYSSKQFDFLNKLWDELRSTDRNTAIRPNQEPTVRLNILTNDGMKNMGQSRTGETTATNLRMNIGTGTTAETVNDHVTWAGSLQIEKARLAMGSRITVDQQERYSAAFNDNDVTGEPLNITEAGINTLAAAGIQVARVTFTGQVLDVGYTMAFQALVNHRNGVAS